MQLEPSFHDRRVQSDTFKTLIQHGCERTAFPLNHVMPQETIFVIPTSMVAVFFSTTALAVMFVHQRHVRVKTAGFPSGVFPLRNFSLHSFKVHRNANDGDVFSGSCKLIIWIKTQHRLMKALWVVCYPGSTSSLLQAKSLTATTEC